MPSHFPNVSRRAFLGAATAAVALATETVAVESEPEAKETYQTHAKGLRIFPGAWRPHYPWEHIAWISPSWPSQDYIWLDFPEAIFTDRGLLYLSHINPAVPAVYESWPAVAWQHTETGIAFERELPDGVRFGGSIAKGGDQVAELELYILNGANLPLKNISLQTCAFLRAIREFGDYSASNKYVHVPEKGWVAYPEAQKLSEENGRYGLGFRSRKNRKADWPVMATVSNQAGRLVAMTWLENTLSMVTNPNHPCMHADPFFKDLEPGERASIHGRLIFVEGPIQEFDFTAFAG